MKIATLTAALLAASVLGASAQQAPIGAQGQPQGQNFAFCMNTGGGSTNCGFATMAQCEEAKKGVSAATCTQNPQTGQSPASSPGTNTPPSR
jgi:ABC-type sugar transport system substrate-binding protein